MDRSRLEPGLLPVLRFYAWLRLPVVAAFLLPAFGLMAPPHSDTPLIVPLWFTGFVIAHSLLLIVLLYLPPLESWLRRAYLPLLLTVAAGGLMVEQHLVFFQRLFWESTPLLYILLILVTWQYRWRGVLVFTAAIVALQVALNLLLPLNMLVIFARGGEVRDLIVYASIVARAASFLVIGFVVSRLVEAQRRQHRELMEANARLVRHAGTLEQLTVTRERVRLSRELHDTLAHTLSALAVQIDAVLSVWGDEMPGRAQTMLERMLGATRLGLDETRRALRDLRAAPLDETGLIEALRALAQDFALRHSLELHLQLPNGVADLPPEVEQCFYRVAQEALENTARHAAAAHLTVQLTAGPGSLALSVQDDGIGFDAAQPAEPSRLGLQGMRERAELIGAHLVIDSRPGAGTAVRLDWEAA